MKDFHLCTLESAWSGLVSMSAEDEDPLFRWFLWFCWTVSFALFYVPPLTTTMQTPLFTVNSLWYLRSPIPQVVTIRISPIN